METFSVFFGALFQALAQGAPYIIIGYLAASIIREFVPVRVLTSNFSDNGILPILRAVGVGAFLPICSCGVMPLGVGAFKCGSARGTTLSFMTSAPTLSPVGVLVAFSYLGPRLTLTFIGVVLAGSFLIGFIGNRILGGKEEEAFRATLPPATDEELLENSKHKTFFAKVKGAIRWAFWDLGSDVSLDLLFGLTLAAAILTFLPLEWIATWFGTQKFATLIYVILLGIPVYTCSVPSFPVVRSLLLMGMSPGAGVAYLIAGPATNLGELTAIRRNMGTKAMAVFVTGLFTMALVGGLLTDHLIFPNYDYKPTAVTVATGAPSCCVPAIFGKAVGQKSLFEQAQNVPVWHYPFIVLLGVTLVLGAARKTHGFLHRKSKPADPESGVAATAGRAT